MVRIVNGQEVDTELDISHLVIEDDALLRVWRISPLGYSELTLEQGITEVGESVWLARVGLGLTLWEGEFEEPVMRLWMRWCNQQGQVILTGAERADTEQQRAERLAERLRAMGVNPDELDEV
ncbi:MAG: hypothetical protein KME07_15810 [Pegethrix bostrychoides GSE-TBD4-15B]|uniref:Uncharacterized protein n=1 Tax=Pegethrix bostrychoides GSE-TBD4-15B TaxID=2839662 RepID=A0A951U5R3_9CYAN|nr:hypothetical protein [Pegethrix bostrychoides GSE-TBD4-15B]